MPYIDILVQDSSNSSALAMELLQSCTKPPINQHHDHSFWTKRSTVVYVYSGLYIQRVKNPYVHLNWTPVYFFYYVLYLLSGKIQSAKYSLLQSSLHRSLELRAMPCYHKARAPIHIPPASSRVHKQESRVTHYGPEPCWHILIPRQIKIGSLFGHYWLK